MADNYFSIAQDGEVITDGGFFCRACVMGKPADEQSPDPRYCLGCYVFLLKETKILPVNRRPNWIPRSFDVKKACRNDDSNASEALQGSKLAVTTACHMEIHRQQAVTAQNSGTQRIVVEKIRALVSEGKSCRAIEKDLKNDGITMSYRTIQRRIQKYIQGVLV